MSQTADKLSPSRVEQLSDFENRLLRSLNDESMLEEIEVSIRRLVSGEDGCEEQIREILQSRFDAGELRPESVELVQQVLDQIAPESHQDAGNVELTLLEDESAAASVVLNDDSAAPAIPGEAEEREEPLPAPAPAVISADPRAYKAERGPPDTGTLLAGRFLLQNCMPSGGFGTVYRAVDERLSGGGASNTNIAIQILPQEHAENENAKRALQQEVAKGRCLKHPNIVRFIDTEHDGDLHFVVMERLDGKSLATILEEADNQKIGMSLALDIVASVGSALEFAHRRGVLHADLQPGNIIISPEGEVKLFNFGMARVRQNDSQSAGNTAPRNSAEMAATYSSLQVLTGEEPVVADDVFSLGCLMYRLVAGFRVFGPRNAADAAAEGLEPQKLPELEAAQWLALNKSLSLSRTPRFASCAEFITALDGLVEIEVADEEEEEEYEPTATVETLAMTARRKPWLLVAAGVGLAAGAAFLLLSGASESTQNIPLSTTQAVAETVTNDTAIVAETASVPVEVANQTEADFAAMLPPTLTVGLISTGQYVQVVDLKLREGGDIATIDVVRMRNILEDFSVLLEEVEVEDTESLWGSGQYEVSNDGLLTFESGQSRARATLSMPADQLREQDAEVTLRIRDADDEESELALIRLQLEDDDQRKFELGLPRNTMAFAVPEVSVKETDAAVQIDVMRFQPDNEPAEVSYVVRDVTATAGEDYFPPDVTTVQFGRGQRTARIIIPLVQDVDVEVVESFTLELVGVESQGDLDIFQRIAVMIRDEE